jgi:hypothetical protein
MRAKVRNLRKALFSTGRRLEIVLLAQQSPQDVDVRGHVVHEQYAVLMEHGEGPCFCGFDFSG